MPPRVRPSLPPSLLSPVRARGARRCPPRPGRHDLDEDLERLSSNITVPEIGRPRVDGGASPGSRTRARRRRTSSRTRSRPPRRTTSRTAWREGREGWANARPQAGARPDGRRRAGDRLRGHPLDRIGRPADRADRREAQRRRQLDGAATIATGDGPGVWTGVLSGAVPIFVGNALGQHQLLGQPDLAGVDARGRPRGPARRRRRVHAEDRARLRAGRVWVAWYSSGSHGTGIYVQQIDGATGQPIGAPALGAWQQDIDNNSLRHGARVRRDVPPRLRR